MKEIRVLWMTTFKIFLELIRIIILFFIIGCVMWGCVKLIYTSLGINVDGSYAGWLGESQYIVYCLSSILINCNFQDFIMVHIAKNYPLKALPLLLRFPFFYYYCRFFGVLIFNRVSFDT